VDVTERAGLKGEGYGMGAVVGDYDNDGNNPPPEMQISSGDFLIVMGEQRNLQNLENKEPRWQRHSFLRRQDATRRTACAVEFFTAPPASLLCSLQYYGCIGISR
jgi:hypothetical protein